MPSFILDTSGVICSIIIDELSAPVMSLTKVLSLIVVSLLSLLVQCFHDYLMFDDTTNIISKIFRSK